MRPPHKRPGERRDGLAAGLEAIQEIGRLRFGGGKRRRVAKLDVGQLNEEWIIAVRSWLAHKDRTAERMMDDLAAELRLRKLEPPYSAVEQGLADRSAQTKEAERKKAFREVAREIGEFMRENDRPFH